MRMSDQEIMEREQAFREAERVVLASITDVRLTSEVVDGVALYSSNAAARQRAREILSGRNLYALSMKATN